jgi:hypothetical protein
MDSLRITIKYIGSKAARLTSQKMPALMGILQRDLLALRLNYPKQEDVSLTEPGAISFIRRVNTRDRASRNVNSDFFCDLSDISFSPSTIGMPQ